MDFAGRIIVSLWIISTCILSPVGMASNDDNFCGSNFTHLHEPCLLQQQTLVVPLNKDIVSRAAKILMTTDLANSLPPKNFSLKSQDNSISFGGKITTDYFSGELSKRWSVKIIFSPLPNELKNITLVQIIFTVVNFKRIDDFLSTIHIHVNDTIYEMPFHLFHVQDQMSTEGTPTTSTIPSESENSSTSSAIPSESESSSTTSAIPSESESSSTTSTIPSESESSSTTTSTTCIPCESEGKPYPILLILLILSIIVNVVLIIIWICFPHQVERWRSQNCLLQRIESAIHGTKSTDSSSPQLIKYTKIPQSNISRSPGHANTHEMEVRIPMADTNQDRGSCHEQDKRHQLPTTGGSPCTGQANDTHEMEVRVNMADTNQDRGSCQDEQDETHRLPTTVHSPDTGQANGETHVVDIHQTERVDPTEQQQPTASSSMAEINQHAPTCTEACTEACTGTLSALGDETTEPGEDIADMYSFGKPDLPERYEAQGTLIHPEETDQESDSDNIIMG